MSATDRAEALLDWVREDPTPERIEKAQDQMDALAEGATGDDLAGVQDAGQSLEMIADFVLDPQAQAPPL